MIERVKPGVNSSVAALPSAGTISYLITEPFPVRADERVNMRTRAEQNALAPPPLLSPVTDIALPELMAVMFPGVATTV